MTSRIMMMPRMPPARITQIFGDIATATRIESIANTMSVSSTLTTVAQKADSPNPPAACGGVRRALGSAVLREVVEREVQQIAGADELHPPEPNQVGGEQRGNRAEREGADDPVAQRLLLPVLRQPEDQHRQHHGVVGAEQSLEHDQEPDRDEVCRLHLWESQV